MSQPQLLRPDETYHRLLWWTHGQAPSERVSGHILRAEGYEGIDPSHPLGGSDQGADATCVKHGQQWVMASYFPYGPQPFSEIKKKLADDVKAARHRQPFGIAFVTNQKLTIGDRKTLTAIGGQTIAIEVYHLERIVHIVDSSDMAQIRQEFLHIPAASPGTLAIRPEVIGEALRFTDSDHLLERWAAFNDRRELQREREARNRAAEDERSRAADQGARLAWLPYRNPLAMSPKITKIGRCRPRTSRPALRRGFGSAARAAVHRQACRTNTSTRMFAWRSRCSGTRLAHRRATWRSSGSWRLGVGWPVFVNYCMPRRRRRCRTGSVNRWVYPSITVTDRRRDASPRSV
jgi:hypothetical protein